MKSGRLMASAVVKMLSGVILMGLLLFLPAGSIRYWNAWLLIGALFIPMLFVGGVLVVKSPELLQKRLNHKETEKEQVQVVLVSAVLFVASFLLAGFDYRLGWSHLPMWLVIVATVVFLAAYGIYVEVMRENAYLSRTVEIQENQKVIDTGLYGIVRHPMYFATVLLFGAMPLVLGSLPAFLVLLPYPFILAKRIRNEEQVLEKGLAGYTEYKKRVRYRILPFIW